MISRTSRRPAGSSPDVEDGEERINTVVPLCRKYGAAVIALTIDEKGMAKTASAKLAVARGGETDALEQLFDSTAKRCRWNFVKLSVKL